MAKTQIDGQIILDGEFKPEPADVEEWVRYGFHLAGMKVISCKFTARRTRPNHGPHVHMRTGHPEETLCGTPWGYRHQTAKKSEVTCKKCWNKIRKWEKDNGEEFPRPGPW